MFDELHEELRKLNEYITMKHIFILYEQKMVELQRLGCKKTVEYLNGSKTYNRKSDIKLFSLIKK